MEGVHTEKAEENTKMRMRMMITSQSNFTRFKSMLTSLSCLALLLGTVTMAPLQARAQGSRYSLTVYNRSAYPIERLYVSSSDLERWGPDQLGSRVILPGSSFVLTNIVPGEYDLKVIDQEGRECIKRGINVFDDKSWTLY